MFGQNIGLNLSFCPTGFELYLDSVEKKTAVASNLPLPMESDLECRLWPEILSTNNSFHSAVKPWIFKNNKPYYNLQTSTKTQFLRSKKRIRGYFHELYLQKSVIEYSDTQNCLSYLKGESFFSPYWKIRIDPLIDFNLGHEKYQNPNTQNDTSENLRTTWINLRGLRIQGYFGPKFAFRSQIWLHNGVYPTFINQWIDSFQVFPGRIQSRQISGKNVVDYYLATSHLIWNPNPRTYILLGHEKNFIGYGYRSMLWSDFSSPYTHLKINYCLGPLQYTYSLGKHTDLKSRRISGIGLEAQNGLSYAQKYSVNGILDWNINKRLQLGLYHAVIWAAQDTLGRRGIDLEYLNPFIFLRPIEFSLGSVGNALLGLNIGYKLNNNNQLYGQLLIDELHVSKLLSQNGSWVNKYAWQFGLRLTDPFKTTGLRIRLENNGARPYTYSHWSSTTSYTNMNQPLAHPSGANFIEFLLKTTYLKERWAHTFQGGFIYEGIDTSYLFSVGKDLLKSYILRTADENLFIGNGMKNNFLNFMWSTTYLIHPPTNLKLEFRIYHRNQRFQDNINSNIRSTWITVGIRCKLDELYHDF